MVQISRRGVPPEEARDLNLPAGRGQDVLAANHEIDALIEIVDHDRELIGPVSMAIAREDIAGDVRGDLFHRPQPEIGERDALGREEDPPALVNRAIDVEATARARITNLTFIRTDDLRDRLPRTRAWIDQARVREPAERFGVSRPTLALTGCSNVRDAAEPFEIFENLCLELRP